MYSWYGMMRVCVCVRACMHEYCVVCVYMYMCTYVCMCMCAHILTCRGGLLGFHYE